MISLFLLVPLVLAVDPYFYIGPEGYTIDDSPLVFWVRDESPFDNQLDHTRISFDQCIRDKGFHFKILADQEWTTGIDTTKRTFTMQYYARSQCAEADLMKDRKMKLVYYADIKTEGCSEDEMKAKYPLWIHYSPANAGSDEHKIYQFSKKGCIDAVGFEFTFTSKGCYHHVFAPKSKCQGVDSIAKYVKNGEIWGSGIYHVADGQEENPEATDKFAEGDIGFFYYLDMEKVLGSTIDSPVNGKYYEYHRGSLKIYKKTTVNNKDTFVYWQDAIKNPSEENKIATGYICDGKDGCSTTATGTEYIMTTECVGGKVFVKTCDEIIRARKKKVADNCNSVFTDEDTTIVVATDRQGVMYFNESYYHIILPQTTCPQKSCNGDNSHMTEFFYRRKTVTTDRILDGDKRSIIYQYVPYAGKNYVLALYYTDSTYNQIDYNTNAVIEGEHSTQCWERFRKELHFYTHKSLEEAEVCWGYGVGRADFFQIAECHDGQFFYVQDTSLIDVYECEYGDQYWDINTVEGVGNVKLYNDITQGHQVIYGINYYVYYDVSLSFYDSYENAFEPFEREECTPYLDTIPVTPDDKPSQSEGGNNGGNDNNNGGDNNDKPAQSEGGNNGGNDDNTPAQSSNGQQDNDNTPTQSSNGQQDNDNTPTESDNNDKPTQSSNGQQDNDNTPTESSNNDNNNNNTPTQSSNGQQDNDDNNDKPSQSEGGNNDKPTQSESGNNNNNDDTNDNNDNNKPTQSDNNEPTDDAQDGAKSLFTFALLIVFILF